MDEGLPLFELSQSPYLFKPASLFASKHWNLLNSTSVVWSSNLQKKFVSLLRDRRKMHVTQFWNPCYFSYHYPCRPISEYNGSIFGTFSRSILYNLFAKCYEYLFIFSDFRDEPSNRQIKVSMHKISHRNDSSKRKCTKLHDKAAPFLEWGGSIMQRGVLKTYLKHTFIMFHYSSLRNFSWSFRQLQAPYSSFDNFPR